MKSRVGRLEWWTTFIVANLVSFQATGFLYRSVLQGGELSDAPLQSKLILGLAHAAILTVTLVVQRDISTRRAHDRDVRPIAFWVYAAASVVSFAASFSISATGSSVPFSPAWIWAPPIVAFAWVAMEFGARPGDPMTNRWGPAPRHPFDRPSPKPDNYRPPRI